MTTDISVSPSKKLHKTITKAAHPTALDYAVPQGSHLTERVEPFGDWIQTRVSNGLFPYWNVIHDAPSPEMLLATDTGEERKGLNFGSQDYLALTSSPQVREAARVALQDFGPHSAGSPALQGNTPMTLELEEHLSDLLQMEHVVLYPTGWAAGYGVVTGLVRPHDHIVIDKLAHNCLVQGAQTATRNIHRNRHCDVSHVREILSSIRAENTSSGVLVVTEGLFSMDADTPDLRQLQEVCREYDAVLLIDVAHDLGSMGPDGAGSIGAQKILGEVDIVMGSFSKTFASNGGFVATNSYATKQYLRYFSPSHTFSNALSPIQAAVVVECLRIVRSSEGEKRRVSLMKAINALRDELLAQGIEVLGQPSPIVPAVCGHENLARRAARVAFEEGLFANLVEFPAVAQERSRFRMQVMASHTIEQSQQAARLVARALRRASEA